MVNFISTLFLLVLTSSMALSVQGQLYLSNEGSVAFVSDAPLERIAASSNDLSGAINLSDNRFAFRLANKSFLGFNSPLQQEHFYENYIESDKYTYSSFQGKIIEEIVLNSNENQEVRAKGVLSIHGFEQERIISATIRIEDNMIYVESDFQVALEDHGIRIPKVVYNKIAEVIDVKIRSTLKLQQE
jgi:hypothetical protein